MNKETQAALAAGQVTAAPAQPAAQCAVYATLPESFLEIPDVQDESGINAYYSREAVLECIDAALASHGLAPDGAAQADSVPAVSDLPPLPAPDLRDVGTKPQEIKEFLKGYATEYARTAIAARAPADSVQEDAARLDWLEQNLFHREKDEWDTKFGGYKEYNMWALFSPKGIQGRARDIIDAARKQGASRDR